MKLTVLYLVIGTSGGYKLPLKQAVQKDISLIMNG